MPSNIEIKARLADPARQYALAKQLADGPAEVLHQTDTFFKCPHGRLKLRVFPSPPAELIFYRRPDQPGPKHSEYQILPIPAPEETRTFLAAALGEVRTVQKVRTLYMKGQTRIHLDEVQGLGSFLELEVVLHAEQSLEEGQTIAEELLKALEISPDALISGAYADLLGTQAAATTVTV
ncbi:MAG: class IV adenylate cyclase [Candidatus Methylacidiphilales bacterium]|nr:class IV adenylate cyclase [Candidatus Methylacidiphilales bacterium]